MRKAALAAAVATLASQRATELRARRADQRSRSVGFTYVSNMRLEQRIAAAAMAAKMSNPNLSMEAAYSTGQAAIARGLPPGRMVRSYHKRATKNANAAYRKAIWPAAKFAGAHNCCGASL